ncbi:hypothetical protein FB451DRAFT_1163413 [Mycena latifolia]|nr:hypothetical protein FB451DRAFT_1163413 [Mycena latifolia]
MSSSSDSGRGRRSHDRPILPPIRDLFRDLSSSESPALTLARLRVSDDEDRPRHAYPSSSHGPHSRPTSTRPPSRSYPDPPTFVPPQQARSNTMPAVYDRSRSSVVPGPGGSYPAPQYPNAHPRSMSYDPAAYPPPAAYPGDRPVYDPRYDSRGPYNNAMMGQPPPQPVPSYYARTQPPNTAMPPVIATSIRASRAEDDDRTPVARYQPSGLAGFAPPDASTGIAGPAKYECSYCGKGFSRPSSLRIHLNSHTGEKPFVCPVDGCGRSFSVLSNMRRHARVHVTPLMPGDVSERPITSSSQASTSPKWKHHRRDSSASASSSGSRRSRSVSSEEEDYDRPEKRIRHQHRK